MRTAILDTSVLLSPDLGTPRLDLSEFRCRVSSISYAELSFGLSVTDDVDQRAERQLRYDQVRAHFGAGVPVTDKTAASYGLLFAVCHRANRTSRARSLDIMIAATAHELGATVVTRNTVDLDAIAHLVQIARL